MAGVTIRVEAVGCVERSDGAPLMLGSGDDVTGDGKRDLGRALPRFTGAGGLLRVNHDCCANGAV